MGDTILHHELCLWVMTHVTASAISTPRSELSEDAILYYSCFLENIFQTRLQTPEDYSFYFPCPVYYYLLRRFFYGLATQDRGKLRTIHNTSVFYHQLPRHVPIYIYYICSLNWINAHLLNNSVECLRLPENHHRYNIL